MITGGCLCGGVRFEVDAFVGPFELCHCNRCRKVSGTAFMAAIGVRRDQFRWLSGTALIKRYELPDPNTSMSMLEDRVRDILKTARKKAGQ